MKLLLLAFLVIFLAKTTLGNTCTATDMCTACSSTGTCTQCWSWATGLLGARVLTWDSTAAATGGACTTIRTSVVTHAKMYSPYQQVSQKAQIFLCTDGLIVYIDANTNWWCVEPNDTISLMSNCEQTGYLVTSAIAVLPIVQTQFCVFCSGGHVPTGTVSYNALMYGGTTAAYFGTGCATANAINNCFWSWYEIGTAIPSCYGCLKDYALNTSGVCTSFTSDPYCKNLDSTGTACGTCWYSYYFSGTSCTMFANI